MEKTLEEFRKQSEASAFVEEIELFVVFVTFFYRFLVRIILVKSRSRLSLEKGRSAILTL